MSGTIESLLRLITTALLSLTLVICRVEGQQLSEIETTAYGLDIKDGLTYIDSMESTGFLEHHVAEGLRARIMNRPGMWEEWGEQTETCFASALAEYEREGLSTQSDSVSYCSLLLDYAYFSARAAHADTSNAGYHRSAEVEALKHAFRISVSPWQRERAAMEQARFHSRHGGSSSPVDTLFQGVVATTANTDALGPAYWHWVDWLIETRGPDAAHERLREMADVLRGTKWESRALDLLDLVSRTELFIETVESAGSHLRIVSSVRNVSGELSLVLRPASGDTWYRSCGFPGPGRLGSCSDGYRYTVAASVDMTGEVLTWRIPAPPPGLFEMGLSFGDTVAAYSLGVFTFRPIPRPEETGFSITDLPSDVTVSACIMDPDEGWRTVDGISRSERTVMIPREGDETIQIFISGEQDAGWWGTPGTGPLFHVFPESRRE